MYGDEVDAVEQVFTEGMVGDALLQVGIGGTITPLPWFNIVVSSGYAWNVSATNKGGDDLAQTVRTATQRIKFNVYVTKQLTLTASAEDNYNNLTKKNRHVWFGDLSTRYKLKYIELELQANNLFNQRQYTSVRYSGLDILTSTSQLRPLNITGTVRFKIL
jgi:outer membrane receptor protein involved in Fe transport